MLGCSVVLCVLALLAPAAAAATEGPAGALPADVVTVLEALDGHAGRGLWPGFDPRVEPVAIYDGESTFLLRHPSPPEEFAALPGQEGVAVFAGKHPAMRWISTADIGGVRTATLLLSIEPGRPLEESARLLLHEVFHVYSKALHPTWRPNEMDRYTYPFDDPEVDRLLLLEEAALARAATAGAREETAAWAARALSARRERRARIAAEHVAFEEALELQEGTATHVERLSAGRQNDTSRLLSPPPPEGVRWRFYEIGGVMAAVLGRLDPEWKTTMDAAPETTFTGLLSAALTRLEVEPASLEAAEAEALRGQARDRVAALGAARARLRESFAGRGVPVVVVVPDGGEPLRFARFDPTALEILGGGDVLHTHGVVLERDGASLEVDNPHFVRNYRNPSYDGVLALTAAAGGHPLGDGVRRVEVAGFAAAPSVVSEDGSVRIEGEGLKASFTGARLTWSGGEIVVELPPPTP